MDAIQLTGWINDKGELEIDLPSELPVGEVRVTIEPISAEEIAADEALWDEQFARSQDALARMSEQAHAEYLAGLTEDFDPDNDLDAEDL
ncbi:MAG: hypothetical protein IT324_02610 [Anaerolineae bacterium]|nr:hypothetical protein [Anaerolineae bacterium]